MNAYYLSHYGACSSISKKACYSISDIRIIKPYIENIIENSVVEKNT